MVFMVDDSDERSGQERGIERELRRGSIELALLHLLDEGEAYGYEIATAIAERTDGELAISDGTLYPVLYRLEKNGLVAVRWETQERGVPRKYYRLTDAGRTELVRLREVWLRFTRGITRMLSTGRGET